MQFEVSYRQILKLAAPISLSLLIPQVSFMANAAFLGRLGQTELVVNGISSIFYLLLTWIGFGLSNGIMVLLSRRAGEGDIQGLSRTFSNGFLLSVIGSMTLMLLSFWLSPVLFGLTLHHEDIFFKTVDFIYLRIWGLPFLMLTQLMNVFYIATNRSRWLIYGALSANLINILLDYVLIFGKGPFAPMGLEGAAVASIAAEITYCLIMAGIFWIKKLHRQYPVFSYLHFDAKITHQILKVSAPLILQYVFSIGGWQIFYIYIEHLGTTELAASHILRSVLGIMSIGTWALASTCNTMTGNILGQGKKEQVMRLVRKIMTISLSYAAIISLLIYLAPRAFFAAYTDDIAVVETGLGSLYVVAISSLIMSLATVCFNAVVGTGNTFVNLAIEVFCVLMYIVYITVVVEHMRAPLSWAWASEFIYWSLLLLTSGGYLLSGRWKGKKI